MGAIRQPRAPGPLPSGAVTFVFTDIVGSTQRWERHRTAMEGAVRRHDAIVRTAIAEHGGHVFKTVGDAFCAAFARPERALAATLDAQRRLAAADFTSTDGLQVRAAIHTGTADERSGDYFGPTVNRVARLLAIGHGGQVLVSGVTTDLVRGDLPPAASLRDLGDHRLRDLTRPERVYQLVAPDLAPDFPPLRSLDVLPNNLPRMLTSFVGRETEIAEITALVAKHQLVTLVGSGGVGKTRTSLQVAANLLDGSGDGVWFIELAPLSSGDYIAPAVAQALGIALAADGDPLENLVRELQSKHALLVFDNCEHLLEHAAHAVAVILRGCLNVRVVASSRQGLGIAGEATFRMPSLTVPSANSTRLSAIETAHFAAVALFVERAAAADNRFVLSDENAPIIADICRRLDGIPLAIELASSRVKILSPRQLRDRLDERFRVLTGGSRDVLPRQQTLRALFDWSHDLLDERERVLFRRLGIFVNGFALEGAIATGSGEELDVFDALASLVDKSLVLAEPHGDALRYRLLESTRAYSSEKLSDAGERDLLAGRHLHYLRDRFAALRAAEERTARQTEMYEAAGTELEDVRAALDWALKRPDAQGGAGLLAELYGAWSSLGLVPEGVARIEMFLAALPEPESLLRARLWGGMSALLQDSGLKLRALEAAAQAVAHARASGDGPTLGTALGIFSRSNIFLQRLEDAEKALAEAEAIPGASAELRLRLLTARGLLSIFSAGFDTAAKIHEELRLEHRSLRNTRGELSAVVNLAEIEHARGQTQRAIALVREALPTAQRGTDKPVVTVLLHNLAGYLITVDDLAGAASAAREAIGFIAAQEPDHTFVAVALEHLALVCALRGDLPRAAKLEAYAVAAFHRHGFERESTEQRTSERLAALLRDGIEPDELVRLSAEGAALTAEAAVALALGPAATAQGA